MTLEQFLKLAYPNNLREEDIKQRTVIFRWHRRLGIYLAYLFYHLRVSANFISMSRIFVAFVSLGLISLVIRGDILMPLIGVFLLYGQHILDQVDGAVARASGKISKLGAELDGVASSVSRFAIMVLLAVFTGDIPFILFAVFLSYILVIMRDSFIKEKIAYDTEFKGLAIFFRLVFSIQVMLFILPLLIVLTNILGWSIVKFSYIALIFYGAITVIWFILSFYKFYQNKLSI